MCKVIFLCILSIIPTKGVLLHGTYTAAYVYPTLYILRNPKVYEFNVLCYSLDRLTYEVMKLLQPYTYAMIYIYNEERSRSITLVSI